MLAAFALRLPGLSYSFYGDEWFSVIRDSESLLTDTEDRFRPLFFSLLYLWQQIGFSGELGLRLLPLLFGLLQVPLAYSIGSQLRSRDYGLLFAALIVVSPIMIEFSQELRMYSMVACLALLQVWLLLYLQRVSSWSGWLSFILVAVAGIYTHIFYWIFLMGISLSLLRSRPAIALWKSVGAMVIVVLLYLPNVYNLFAFTERRGADYAVHLPSALPKLFAAFTVGFNYFVLPDLGATRAVGWGIVQKNLLIALPVLVVGLLLVWGFLLAHKKQNRAASLWFGHELFTIPVLIAAAASFMTGKYFLQPKYLIFSAPFLLLLLIESTRALRAMSIRWSIAGLSALIVAVAFVHFTHPERYGRKENWRDVAHYLESEIRGNDIILTFRRLPQIKYYSEEAGRKMLVVEAPEQANSLTPLEKEKLSTIARDHDEIYFINWDTNQNAYDPHDHLPAALDRLIGEHAVRIFNPRMQIFVWKPPPAIETN